MEKPTSMPEQSIQEKFGELLWYTSRLRGASWSDFGLTRPNSWFRTILQTYRRQGIGKRLIRRFIQRCAESGIQRIITDSDDEEHLRRFYASLGFRITAVNYELDIFNQ